MHSSEHTYTRTISSKKLEANGIKKRRIRSNHPETKELLKFEIVTVTGTCCWKGWNAYVGGQSTSMGSVGTWETGWPVRSVELFGSCDLE